MFDAFLSDFAWYRRVRGGHWERWYIDMPFCSDIWLRRPHGGDRPPGGRGTPLCEGHP